LSRVVFRISVGFLVGTLVLLATALSLSEYYLGEARRLAAAGDAQGALEASRMAARLDPFDIEALETQSFFLEQQGRYEDAATSLREATERDPHNYITHLMLGNLQFGELDDLDAAVESYREVLRLNPMESSVREVLARALMQQGKLGEAREEYERLREEGDISFQGLFDLGRIYVRTGAPREGLQEIKRAKRRAESELEELEGPLKGQRRQLLVSMQLAIADALVVQGRYDEAREIIAQSASPQAPALLQLLDSNPDAYRESVVTGEIY
jgi:tetratricopeptide (TPR) repeat protein